MKKIFFLVAIVAALYSAAWFGVAVYLKNEFTGAFIETESKKTTHGDVSVTGFPLRFNIEIADYQLTTKDLHNIESSEGTSTAEIITSVKTDLFLSSNLLATDYIVKNKTPLYLSHRLTVGEEEETSDLILDSNALYITAKLNKSFLPLIATKPRFDEILTHIEDNGFSINIALKDYSLKEAKTNKVVTKVDYQSIELTAKPQLSDIAIKLTNKNLRVFPPSEKNSTSAIDERLHRFGPINFDMHLNYKGPVNFEEKSISSLKDLKFDVEIPVFNLSTDLLKYDASGSFNYEGAVKGKPKLRLLWKDKSTFDEKWHRYALEDLDESALQELLTAVGGGSRIAFEDETLKSWLDKSSEFGYTLDKQSTEEMLKVLKQIQKFIPKMHEFGTIITDIDVRFDENAFAINKLHLLSDLYGIKIQGTYKDTEAPDVNASINLINYKPLISDFVSYLKTATITLEEITNEPIPRFKEGLPEEISVVLAHMSETPNRPADDLTLVFKTDEELGLLVGEESAFLSAMELFMTVISYIEESPPATPASMAMCYDAAKKKQWAHVRHKCDSPAKRRDPQSQLYLGYSYLAAKKPISQEDAKLAFHWIYKSATQDHPAAFYSLGRLYQKGIGVEKNNKLAMQWYEKSFIRAHNKRALTSLLSLAKKENNPEKIYFYGLLQQHKKLPLSPDLKAIKEKLTVQQQTEIEKYVQEIQTAMDMAKPH